MTTIGVDLTPIQGPHRMRGVGSVVINVMRHMSDENKKSHTFIFYLYEDTKKDALDIINANSFSNYRVRTVPNPQPLPPSIKTRSGILNTPKRIYNIFLNKKLGNKRITNTKDLDVFLQFEQDIIPPPRVKSVVVAHDLIPYILETDYLWSYSTARKLHNYSRRGALKAHVKRMAYLRNIQQVVKRAHKVISNSNHTKADFIKYANVPTKKVETCHLGISSPKTSNQLKPELVDRYISTSWGDIKTKTTLPNTPFLLFVGGADPRRKLADLIHAFNLLRAQGQNIHLVLAGDTMLGPNSIPNNEAREALLNSSYLNNIYMLGFIDEQCREWLYQNALAFVYPSTYEGFGLPILEAMRYGTPVITYRGSSITEIADNVALFAHDSVEISQTISKLISDKKLLQKKKIQGKEHARNFSWEKTANNILKSLQTTP